MSSKTKTPTDTVIERDGFDLKTNARLVGALNARLDMLNHHAIIALCRGTGARGKRCERDLDIALPRRMHAGRLATSKHQAKEAYQHADRHNSAACRHDNARHGVAQQQHKAIRIRSPELADKRTQRHDGGGKIHDR